jgi:predicted transcriptional regulator
MYYMAKETMSIRIDPEVREALDGVASAMDRDRTWVVNDALSTYLETYRWQIEHIQQGVREANADKFASSGEVKKVMARLRRK